MALETDVDRSQHFQMRQDERQFRWVYAFIFSISLFSVVFSRMTPWRRDGRAKEANRSMINEAKARAGSVAPLFFMG